MKNTRIIDSFNYAIDGLLHVLRTQRNMRLHFLFAVFVLLCGIYLNLSGNELLLLLVAITFVLCAEIFNTAVECTIDLISNTANPLARIVKDTSAGAVLLTAVNAVVVGYVVFYRYLDIPFDSAVMKVKQSPWHITFIALIVVLSLVIVGKTLLHSGTPFRGGMPSGHAALAFSIWTAIVFSTTNNFVVILTLILAFLVARSRIVTSVHNVWEVLSGTVIGVLITTLVFQILK